MGTSTAIDKGPSLWGAAVSQSDKQTDEHDPMNIKPFE